MPRPAVLPSLGVPAPVLLAGLIVLAFTLPTVNRYGLWFDEIFSVTQTSQLAVLLDMVRTQENNMLLHYLVLWLWQPLGDGSEAFVRAPSIAFTLLALWPLYAGTRRLAGPTAAAAACLLFAGHNGLLLQAVACRGYALAGLWACLLFWRWTHAWGTDSTRRWLSLGLLAGLGVWTHYLAVLAPGVLGVAMLWRDGWRQPWRALVLALVAFSLVAWPIWWTRPLVGSNPIGWAEPPDLRMVIGNLWLLLGVETPLEKQVALALLVPVLAWMLSRPGSGWQRTRLWITTAWRGPGAGLALGIVLVFIAVLVESLLGQPLMVPRFFTPLMPLVCCVLGIGLAQLPTVLRAGILLAVLTTTGWGLLQQYRLPVPDRYVWRPAMTQFAGWLAPTDAVMVYPAFLRLPADYYLDKLDPTHALPRSSDIAGGEYRKGGGVEPEPDWARISALAAATDDCLWLVVRESTLPAWRRLNRVHAPQLRDYLLRDHWVALDFSTGLLRMQCFRKHTPETRPPGNNP